MHQSAHLSACCASRETIPTCLVKHSIPDSILVNPLCNLSSGIMYCYSLMTRTANNTPVVAEPMFYRNTIPAPPPCSCSVCIRILMPSLTSSSAATSKDLWTCIDVVCFSALSRFYHSLSMSYTFLSSYQDNFLLPLGCPFYRLYGRLPSSLSTVPPILVLSVNLLIMPPIFISKLLVHITNSRGPSTDPCGAPLMTGQSQKITLQHHPLSPIIRSILVTICTS